MENIRLMMGVFNDTSEYSSTSDSDEQEEEEVADSLLLSGRSQTADSSLFRSDGDRRMPQNIIRKLLNRERTGCFSSNGRKIAKEPPFKHVPNRLAFHLKEIVPYCYLDDHVFMGLSACGQFLLSYKLSYDEESINHYNFSAPYKYELYFWIYRPHCMLVNYYKVCLFDDHGVDNMKTVTMTQWLSDSHLLIVHGASASFQEDSYITIASVPKLGCRDCIQLRDNEPDKYFASGSLCIKCNLTIHTKYGRLDSDPKFDPKLNLNCPERIVIVANGFIHAVNVKLEMNKVEKRFAGCAEVRGALERVREVQQTRAEPSRVEPKVAKQQEDDAKSIVAKIIADFAECETETVPLEKTMIFSRIDKSVLDDNRSFDELIITCGSATTSSAASCNSVLTGGLEGVVGASGGEDGVGRNGLSQRNYQITAKQTPRQMLRRNCWKTSKITTVDLQGSSSGCSKNMDIAAKTYEFSEDNEKCEKISLFRKRRLADKKYEFSEDNSENIIPFNRLRAGKVRKSSPVSGGSCSSFSTSPPNYAYEMPSHLHRASPSQGFRSPCGSPVGNRCLRSPPMRSYCFNPRSPTYAKPFGMLMSPRQRRPGSSAGGGLFLSPKRECTTPEVGDRPLCSKKFERRYVEEDDAASVITSEEDDCISPGYHLSLPMEVHGSCYSDMQMISQTSYQRLQCPAVVITQNSIDLEALTFHVANHLCQRHDKQYGVFYDWACEVVALCPFSGRLTCLLLVHFTATEKNRTASCLTCAAAVDCLHHRRQFHASTLFTWDTETGEWNVEDYGDLKEVDKPSAGVKASPALSLQAFELGRELRQRRRDIEVGSEHLRVLDSCNEKSKESLSDTRNCVEFYRTSSSPRRSGYGDSSSEAVSGDSEDEAVAFFSRLA
ncbi:uncharacterized protein LOC132257797 [Phlebotomus argentipes]|uniref:uncharacterized protein LOC132257797 n=1 Tax=Phlebotomus argentipes TaxID=94469 RepID=UPI002893599E|nr:uncharacterized protein LOC132257797 [Phlebotomus argentipes]